MPIQVFAHVGYVLSDEAVVARQGTSWRFLSSVFADAKNGYLILATIGFIFAVYLVVEDNKYIRSYITLCQKRARTYAPLVPWMLRLSLGIALIGAGSSQVLVSPALHGMGVFATLQILTGFLLLSGLLLSPATLVAIFLFLIAFLFDTYMVGSFDFLAAAFALGILADPKPGVDHIMGIPFVSPFSDFTRWVPLILRIGVGSAMIYLALYEKIFNPFLSAEVVLQYGLTDIVPVSVAMWVFSAGIVELIVGTLLLVGFQTRLMATAAFVILSLSFFFFGEDVYSHITLFGVLSALFVLGGGEASMDKAGIPKHFSKSIQKAFD